MEVHYVKSWPYLFKAAKSGEKTHDVRRISDRDYKVGDTLVLQEFDPILSEYTGDELRMEITYITGQDCHCALSPGALRSDYCILSMKRKDDD